MAKPPKDYLMAELVYNFMQDNQPQVWFHDLNHDYQMKWVRAVREVVKFHDGFKHKPKPGRPPKIKG